MNRCNSDFEGARLKLLRDLQVIIINVFDIFN